MKKIIILITILIILSTIHCVALDSSIWYKFPVPEYSYSQAYIYTPDFFRWAIHGDESIINLEAGGYYNYFIQHSDFDIWCKSAIHGGWYKADSGNPNPSYERKEISYQNDFGATKYCNIFNIWSEGNFIINARNEYKCRTELDLEIGGGLGRIVNCTPVVRAIRLLKEFEIKEDEDLIFQVADFYAKKAKFSKKYPDTWEEIFYQKIAEMIGFPDQSIKVRRILISGIYETVSRFRGWEVKLGYGNIFFRGIDPHPKGYVTLKAKYQLPWGLTKQVTLQSELVRNFDHDSSKLGVGASFEVEHNYTWASYLEITADKTFNSSGDDEDMNYYISVRTEKNLFNKLVSGLSVEYKKISDSEDPYFNLRLDFKYYLWK